MALLINNENENIPLNDDLITLSEVSKKLGMNPSNIYYYTKGFSEFFKTYLIEKRRYISKSDFKKLEFAIDYMKKNSLQLNTMKDALRYNKEYMLWLNDNTLKSEEIDVEKELSILKKSEIEKSNDTYYKHMLELLNNKKEYDWKVLELISEISFYNKKLDLLITALVSTKR